MHALIPRMGIGLWTAQGSDVPGKAVQQLEADGVFIQAFMATTAMADATPLNATMAPAATCSLGGKCGLSGASQTPRKMASVKNEKPFYAKRGSDKRSGPLREARPQESQLE